MKMPGEDMYQNQIARAAPIVIYALIYDLCYEQA